MLLAVPLGDGTFAPVHVIDGSNKNDLVLVLHGCRSASAGELANVVSWDTALSQRQTGDTPIKEGPWVPLGVVAVDYPWSIARTKTWSSYPLIEHALQAHFGLFPWDGMADPKYFEKWLFPHVPRPPTAARYKVDFDQHGYTYTLRGAPPPVVAHAKTVEAVSGPAEVEVHVLFEPGAARSTMDRLQRAIDGLKVGEVDAVETGAEGGTIVLNVKDAASAVPRLEKALAVLGLVGEVTAVELDEEDE